MSTPQLWVHRYLTLVGVHPAALRSLWWLLAHSSHLPAPAEARQPSFRSCAPHLPPLAGAGGGGAGPGFGDSLQHCRIPPDPQPPCGLNGPALDAAKELHGSPLADARQP